MSTDPVTPRPSRITRGSRRRSHPGWGDLSSCPRAFRHHRDRRRCTSCGDKFSHDALDDALVTAQLFLASPR